MLLDKLFRMLVDLHMFLQMHIHVYCILLLKQRSSKVYFLPTTPEDFFFFLVDFHKNKYL